MHVHFFGPADGDSLLGVIPSMLHYRMLQVTVISQTIASRTRMIMRSAAGCFVFLTISGCLVDVPFAP
jgi:hypothetical protein